MLYYEIMIIIIYNIYIMKGTSRISTRTTINISFEWFGYVSYRESCTDHGKAGLLISLLISSKIF